MPRQVIVPGGTVFDEESTVVSSVSPTSFNAVFFKESQASVVHSLVGGGGLVAEGGIAGSSGGLVG